MKLHRARVGPWWAPGLALVASCSSDAAFLAREGQTTILVAHDGARRTVNVISSGGPISLESERLQALFYQENVAELGLIEGLQTEAPGGRLLPEPQAIWEVRAGDTEWRRLVGVPAELGDLRLPTVSTCIPLEPDPYMATGVDGSGLLFAIRGDDQHVLLSAGGRLYTASAEEVQPLPYAGLPTSLGYYDLGRQQVWLFGPGVAARGTLSGGFSSAPAPPFLPIWVDGNPDPALPEELFAATASAAIWRYFEGGWSEVSPPRGPQAEDTRLTLAWAGPNEAYLTGLGFEHVLEYRDGAARVVSVPEVRSGAGDAFYLARHLPEWGTLLGTRGGHLYRRDGGVWQTFSRPSTTSKIFLIEPLGRGLIFGGEDGVMNQLQPPNTLCAAENYGSFSDQSAVGAISLGNDLVFLSPSPPGVDLRVTVLRRR